MKQRFEHTVRMSYVAERADGTALEGIERVLQEMESQGWEHYNSVLYGKYSVLLFFKRPCAVKNPNTAVL